MTLNTCEMLFNGIKIAFFSKNLQNLAKRMGASPPDPQSLWPLGAPLPDPVCDTFELDWLSQNASKVTYLHYSAISLSPLSLQNPG